MGNQQLDNLHATDGLKHDPFKKSKVSHQMQYYLLKIEYLYKELCSELMWTQQNINLNF